MDNIILFCRPGGSSIHQFVILKEVDEIEFSKTGGFVLVPFNKKKKPFYFKGTESQYSTSSRSKTKNALKHVQTGRDHYRSLVHRATEGIKNNDLQKVVVSRQIQLKGELNYHDVFLDLVESHTNAFVYCIVLDGVTYIGATPEILITKRDFVVNSASLAGTVSRNSHGQFNQWSSKEYEEHKFVTNSISGIYNGFCKKVSISEKSEVIANSVKHLFQNISGELNTGSDFLGLVNKLHPTPAVAGVPKEAAIQWINENENNSRDFYSGYLGVYDVKNADLYVNLRCMKYENEITTIYVGGGIVEGSTFESEFEETEQKAETLLSSIRKFHNIKIEY